MSFLKHSDRHWGSSSALFCARRGLLARGQSDVSVKLTARRHQIPGMRKSGVGSPPSHMPTWLARGTTSSLPKSDHMHLVPLLI